MAHMGIEPVTSASLALFPGKILTIALHFIRLLKRNLARV
jgi:hypothetical protein